MGRHTRIAPTTRTITPSLPLSHSHSHDFATPEEQAAHAREHLADVELLGKPSWRNLLSLGISGGLLPCPSALVVMLSAIGLGRVLFGLYLILGFSLGLAGVLVLTGLALLYAGKFAGRMLSGKRSATFFRYVPILGAVGVTVLGIGIAFDALWQTNLFR
ncbi:MAG: sulfite exporter TauE/SafE family protein [Chloroflexi bacterium]|nr:sulfite exporter TauE/SafE family protein [Chloroflexota bacterium]